EPIALFGVTLTSPGCAQAHLMATPDLTRSDATQIAWRVRDMVIPFLHRRGLHRGEALALSSHRWAHRFLRACGATRMEPRPELGRRREDFTAHVWLRSDLYPDDDATPTQPTGE
ncbi:hypothetical protein, partial [Aphanothece microscopica]|uniref:hypothetical protein n=1 Tax=Aphanothece microscopica TaxID=1049561 RepID=UPI003984C006